MGLSIGPVFYQKTAQPRQDVEIFRIYLHGPLVVLKGVPERKVLYGHALRSAAPPFITVVLSSLVGSMWGGIISEIVWNWPGMGLLYWQALTVADVPVLMALTFVGTFLTVLVYLTMDLLYGVFDPRVRVGTSTSS
ncbi:MAG TPA: ABC transporter permease [Candidatus Aminicenantes bacterium]|nr:ABC transporter permease [Candidatus Aminicenantes bacterium]